MPGTGTRLSAPALKQPYEGAPPPVRVPADQEGGQGAALLFLAGVVPGEDVSWRKYKVRVTTEAIVDAVTGSLAAPRTVLLGRYDAAGRLRYTGRSTTLSQAAGRALADVLAPPSGAPPWEG